MFTLTDALKKHLREVHGVPADADDAKYQAAIVENLKSDKLTYEKLGELTAVPKPDPKAVVKTMVQDALRDELRPAMDAMAKTMAESIKAAFNIPAPAGVTIPAPAQVETTKAGPTPTEVMNAAAANQVRVKGVHEQFSSTKSAAIYPAKSMKGTIHPLAGQRAELMGVVLDQPSDLDKACNYVYLKWALQPSLKTLGEYPRGLRWTEFDQKMLEYMLHEVPWVGTVKGMADMGQDGSELDISGSYRLGRTKLDDKHRKDILDDATSGGTSAVPVTFDDAMVLTPVLYGELFPLVEVVPWARGRLIDGSTMSNPTWTWNTAEGTAITPFSTTAFIAGMDSTVFPIVGAVRLGLDFEDDTPVPVGGNILRKFGEKLLESLDYVIALGDGTTQPQGVFTASGTTTTPSVNTPNGPPTIADYEALYFGVNKAFRRDLGGERAVFIGNDTTYQRCRGIPVGQNDARRVFGMDHASYRVMERPFKVQNDIANTKASYCNLAGYRMYRRLGMTTRIETAGSTLALANERLIVVRARFAGRLTLGGYATVNTTMQN